MAITILGELNSIHYMKKLFQEILYRLVGSEKMQYDEDKENHKGGRVYGTWVKTHS